METQPNVPSIDDLSEQARKELDLLDVTSENYTTGINNLKTIESMKRPKLQDKVDPNVVISALSSIGGILAVLHFEKLGMVASKAFGLISKIRI